FANGNEADICVSLQKI
ncbi:hypothetical protein D030_0033B, partial [Vibrio parahaemolyticus AQ3810]